MGVGKGENVESSSRTEINDRIFKTEIYRCVLYISHPCPQVEGSVCSLTQD